MGRQFGRLAQADDEEPLCLESGRTVQQQSLTRFGLELAAVEDGLGRSGWGLITGEQADFGLRGFIGRGIDREDGKEFGFDCGGRGEEDFRIHRFWEARTLPDHFNVWVAAKNPVAGDDRQFLGEGRRQDHAIEGVAVVHRQGEQTKSMVRFEG